MRDPVPTLIGRHLPTARTRVLVLDDEDLICTVFTRILRDRHDVVGLTTGGAALALIEAGQHFHAVFCDILMPTMCAWEFYQRLEVVAPALALRTVFVSGGAFTPQAAAFVRTHHARVLEKPLNPDVIRAVSARLTMR